MSAPVKKAHLISSIDRALGLTDIQIGLPKGASTNRLDDASGFTSLGISAGTQSTLTSLGGGNPAKTSSSPAKSPAKTIPPMEGKLSDISTLVLDKDKLLEE